MLMKQEDMARLQNKSTYNDGQNEWTIPVFIYKNREITLPQVSIKKQMAEFMEKQKDERIVVYDDEHRDAEASGNSALSASHYRRS